MATSLPETQPSKPLVYPTNATHRVREMIVRFRSRRLPLGVEGRAGHPRQAARLAAALLANLTVEHLIVLHLDNRLNLIGYHTVAMGTSDSVGVHVREIYKAAILSNAASIIVAHNHLGAEATPGEADRAFLVNLQQASKAIGVPLNDFLVVLDPAEGDGYFSFRTEEETQKQQEAHS